MQKAFDGADRFFPITYKEHWAMVRHVAEGSGEKFNKAAFDNLQKAEAEAAAKKAQKNSPRGKRAGRGVPAPAGRCCGGIDLGSASQGITARSGPPAPASRPCSAASTAWWSRPPAR